MHSNFHLIEENFLVKFKYENVSADILNIIAGFSEKVKNYSFASFIFLFLLLNNYLNKKRGLWWYRVILIYDKYLKNKTICKTLLNKSITDPHIKSGYLIKIKKYLERYQVKDKNTQKSEPQNLLKSRYDENLFIRKKRTIQADSVYSKASGRRLYSDGNNLITVEEYAINFYKQMGFVGVHGENMILPALYNIFFWDIIFYDKVPMVFQSPYQTHPLDFFSPDFYKSRKHLIDMQVRNISKFTSDEIKTTIDHIYKNKKNIKSIFLQWGIIQNYQEIFTNIAIAMTGIKLSLIFEEFSKNLKFMIKGMPDLFLWKKDKNSLENSALLVEVKSTNDKLSDHQRYWLHFLNDINQNFELLHIE